MKTGQCKFGVTCKFHHPQPTGVQTGVQMLAASPAPQVTPLSMPVQAPIYQTVQPPPGPSQQQYSVLVARPPLLHGSFVQGPYGPLVVSPTMVPFQGWSPYHQVCPRFLFDCLLELYYTFFHWSCWVLDAGSSSKSCTSFECSVECCSTTDLWDNSATFTDNCLYWTVSAFWFLSWSFRQ